MSPASKRHQAGAHPPKPRLTLAVGITGHRLNNLAPKAIPGVEQALASAFASIDRAVAKVIHDNGGKGAPAATALYAPEPACVRLIHEAADGTDQIAVACRPAGWLAEAVLPYPRVRYREDFGPGKTFDGADRRSQFDAALAACTSIVEWPELLGAEARGRDPYEIAGTFLLRQIDLLVAVWDGSAALGPGGTGALVARALESGIPVIWIASTGQSPPMRLVSVGDVAEPWRLADATRLDIDACVEQILGLGPSLDDSGQTGEAAGSESKKDASAPIRHFYAERRRDRSRHILYDLFARLASGKPFRNSIPLASPESKPANWSKFLECTAEADPSLARRIESILLPRYLWADALGIYYANAYRSAYLEAYLLSTLAIAVSLLAVIPAIVPEDARAIPIKLALALVEIIMIARVMFVVWRGQIGGWHERWLGYRALAEHLRHLRFLSFVGAGPAFRHPVGKAEPKATGWMRWYLAATWRELGLPNGRLEADYQEALLAAVDEFEIADQLSYHGPNSKNLRKLHHSLHLCGDICFALTFLILVIFLVAGSTLIISRWIGSGNFWSALNFDGINMEQECAAGSSLCTIYSVKPFVTYFATLLPALGAAFAGIRFTGDFEGFAQRSEETFAALGRLAETMTDAKRHYDILTTTRGLETLAEAMTEDVNQWQSLYSRKELALPA